MKSLIALLILLAPASGAITCPEMLQRAVFWRPTDQQLSTTVKEGKAALLFRSLGPQQIATLTYAAGDADRVNRDLPVGRALYTYQGLIFTFSPVTKKVARLGNAFGRSVIKILGGDLQLVDYTKIFEKPDAASRAIFVDGELRNWRAKFYSLKGREKLVRFTEFYFLSYIARPDSTTFTLAPDRKVVPGLTTKSAGSPCAGARCSEQMTLLLDPFTARAMVPSGAETLKFLNELRALGFAITSPALTQKL